MQSESFYNFFGFKQKNNFPPKYIRYPKEYDGSNIVNIICTQTELSQSKENKLIKEWCEILPKLDSIKYILFFSKVPQKLFDAVCNISHLEGLYIKWSDIQEMENIKNLTKLKYLHIGSSAQIQYYNTGQTLNIHFQRTLSSKYHRIIYKVLSNISLQKYIKLCTIHSIYIYGV